MPKRAEYAPSLLLWALAIAIVTVQPGAAQIGGSGSIQGTVTDPTGAVVPGASVTATQVATQAKSVRQTTAAGYYVIAPLPAGEYSLSITASGFQTVVYDKVQVDALSEVAINVALKVGASSDSVTVTD